MNDYVVPKEVIEWAKKEVEMTFCAHAVWLQGYRFALRTFLDKINVVYTKETNNVK